MMASDENTHAEKPVKGLSDNSGKMCTNKGGLQLSSDHPSGRTSGGSLVHHMKPGPVTHESKEIEYSHKNPKI